MTKKIWIKPVIGYAILFSLLVFTSYAQADVSFIQLESTHWAEKNLDQESLLSILKNEFTDNRTAMKEGSYFYKVFYNKDGEPDHVILSAVDKSKGSSHLFRVNLGEDGEIQSVIENYDGEDMDQDRFNTPSIQRVIDPELVNGQTVSNLTASRKGWLYYQISLPANARNLIVKTDGGKGDADLFLKFGQRPTLLSYDIKHAEKGNVEVCFEATPKTGIYYVGVYGYYAFSALNLTASFVTSGPLPEDVLKNGETLTDVTGSEGQWLYRKLIVKNNASNLVIRIINGQGDATLYVKYGAKPTLTDYDCRPDKVGNLETCKVKTPKVGEYHIGLYAKSNFHGINLTGSFIDNGKYAITVEKGYEMYKQYNNDPNFILLDTRRLSEFNDVHIEGATHLDFYSHCYYDEFYKLDKNKKYLIHCRTENRSSQAAMMMEQLGFKDFVFFYGGILSWYDKKYPVIENLPPGPGP